MFDLKKRNSLTLNGKEAEEFRRVAVRRKVKGAEVVETRASQTVSGEVSGSYSCGQACDRICGSGPKSREGNNTSSANQTSFRPQVPTKPAHLQSPSRPGPDPASGPASAQCSDAKADLSPNRGYGLSVSPAQTCLGSPSPTRGGGSAFLSAAHSSPVRSARGITTLAVSPLLGSPSPGKRSRRSCSPVRERGHSPARLSPRNCSPLVGKLRTPSPVQGRRGSYSPAKNSKSRLGPHRISKSKMEGQKRKSLSVPDLIIYLEESRITTDKTERSPLRQLQSANCNGSAVPAKAPGRLTHTISESLLSSKELSLGQMNGLTQNGEHTSGETEDKLPTGSTFSTSEDGNIWEEDDDKRRESGGGEPKEQDTNQKLFKIVNELLQTERSYVARLHLLDQVFCSRLTEEAGRGSFPAEVIKNIFSNISSIYSFHSRFLLPDLETCITHWCERPGLGNVLLQHAPFLRMYADYVRNFDQAMELVRTWSERSSVFRTIIQDIQNQEVCGSLTLQHHMLEPVQRVPRYEMLLRDYLKKLPEDNPDYGVAHKCLQTISMAATHSNSAIEKAESRKRLLEIYEMVGEEEVVNPTNELLKEGRLLKLAARNMSAMERHLFLFNNFMLCCTPKFCLVGQRFTVRCRIGVDGMQVQQTTNEDHPYSFQVSGKEKTLELQASSEQDRDEWIKVIREAIAVFQRKNETFKLASKELNIEQPVEELGRRAPRWIRDNEVTVCMKCQEPFNALTRRRHHCRACGCVVCWKCSDTKVALQYDGNKLNKVCRSCYLVLTRQSGDGADGRVLESDMSAVSGEVVISGFLQYGDNTKASQRVWSVIARAEPTLLCLFSAPQEVKQLVSIPLLGCSVEDSPQELQGRPCFRLAQSKNTHTFYCESPDLKRRWLAVLKDAVEGRTPDSSLTDSDVTANGNSSDGGSSSGEEYVVIGDQESCTPE